MNLILFTKEEITQGINASDIRYQHIKKILQLNINESFDCGIINGSGGRGTLKARSDKHMDFDFEALWEPEPLYPVTLICGIPRPPTARRLLKDITSMGIDQIWFTGTELGEKSYLTSKLWKDDKYLDYVLEGAQQGESTLLPEIRKFYTLKNCLDELGESNRCALDNNESVKSIADFKTNKKRTVIAIGSERGWTSKERQLMKEKEFTLHSMGSRVLRTEIACPIAVGFALSSSGKI